MYVKQQYSLQDSVVVKWETCKDLLSFLLYLFNFFTLFVIFLRAINLDE